MNQSTGLPHDIHPDSNEYPNLHLQSGQMDNASFPSHTAPYQVYEPVSNDFYGRSISTFTQVPNPNAQYESNLAHPMSPTRRMEFERTGQYYPAPYGPMASPAVPSTELRDLMRSSSCMCGPGCVCVYCTGHPFNNATIERVQHLGQIMDADNYLNLDDVTPQQSVSRDASMDGTNTGESFPSTAFGWSSTPAESHMAQLNLNEELPVSNGEYSNGLSPALMHSSGYVTMAYPGINHCSNTTGTCRCGDSCTCLGCATHHGHLDLSN